MPPRVVESVFTPTPPQLHFLTSKATVRGYGGAVGGGKSRTLCEAVLDYAIDFPGIQVLVCRLRHTSIIETTRKTMMREVLGPIPEAVARKKESQGEDWVELVNGSRINFIGLDDPVKWMSSEIGCLVFDEAHEIPEGDAMQLMLRLRQACQECSRNPTFEADGKTPVPCEHMPHRTLIGFNPGNPGHWLQEWFILGAAETEFGFYKPELYATDADEEARPIGDCEFVFANAYANPYLPKGYIDRALKSLPSAQRQRLLEGKWVLTDGSLFFDEQALTEYDKELAQPLLVGETRGDVAGGREQPIGVKRTRGGPLAVWKTPVRGDNAHRYVIAVDPSSGGSKDFTGVQVLDVDAFEQVAELQVKLDADLVAVEAFRLAAIYNGALVAVETTGGWGVAVVQAIEKLQAAWTGPRSSMPRLYTRRVEDRISKKFTDILGWDTSQKTRMAMLDALEKTLREREFRLYGRRTHTELTQFVWGKDRHDKIGGKPPSAQAGKHDDLVMSLAIAVYLAVSEPRQIRKPKERPHVALVGPTGY